MASPKGAHILFGTALVLVLFMLINHIFSPSSAPTGIKAVHNVGFTSNIADRLKPLFGGSGSLGSLRDHLQRSEANYQDVIKQRAGLMKDYPDPASPDKDFFPCDSIPSYWKTPFSIWDFVPASFNCPHSIMRLGRMGDGGKWLCGLEKHMTLPDSRKSTAGPADPVSLISHKSALPPGRQPGCIIYSFGIQIESTFEEELLERTPNCQVWGYDFSVEKFGPQLQEVAARGRAFFTQAGIAGQTDMARSPPFYSIQDLMTMNGHDHIDILKMDIEGYEFESMSSVVKEFTDRGEEVPIAQLLVEIHLDPGRTTVDDFLDWWQTLEAAGFRPVWTEPNLLVTTIPLHDGKPRYAEYTFINIKDSRSTLLK